MIKNEPKFDIDFRKEYPTLTQNINGEEVPLTTDEYESTIARWEVAQSEAKTAWELEKTKIQTRQALLDKLGITEDEAKLLLGGN